MYIFFGDIKALPLRYKHCLLVALNNRREKKTDNVELPKLDYFGRYTRKCLKVLTMDYCLLIQHCYFFFFEDFDED